MVVADMLPEFAAHARAEFESDRAGWLRTFQAARFGHSTRKGYVIERQPALTALVDPRHLATATRSAVRCPACGCTGLAPYDDPAGLLLAACPACSHRIERDENGAHDIRGPKGAAPAREQVAVERESIVVEPKPVGADPEPAAGAQPTRGQAHSHVPAAEFPPGDLAPISSTAPIRLLLRADWERPSDWLPVVGTFVAAPLDGRYALCVDATDTTLSISTVYEMLAVVCEEIADNGGFCEILILDTPFIADGTIEVRSADDIRRHLGLQRDDVGLASAERIVAHIQTAKHLADRVAAVAHRFRFLNAPDPWTSREPLVTVRIATWRKPQLLVERAIPSVLNGLYRNVELLVCSDGPDPQTAAVVASIKDPRLRYMEMSERPVYPEQRWSLWETAGSYAANRMVGEMRGSFIAPLCHDDAFTEDHITELLTAMADGSADLTYGQALMERPEGPWFTLGRAPLAHSQVTHGACLYSGRLRHVTLDPECWLLREPGDWNLIRRVTALGAQARFVPRVVLTHFAERSIVNYETADARELDGFVADIKRTGVSWLLDVPVRILEEVAC
ncbi:MAG: glycosyltransferase family 2 protein [Solirubrobacteraceae bacterium]